MDSRIIVLDQAPAGLATKNADTEQLVGAGGANVERQRFQLTGAALLEIARIKNAAPGVADYGLVTRALLYGANGNGLNVTGAGAIAADATGSEITVVNLPVALGPGGGLKVEGIAGSQAQPVSIAAALDVLDRAGRQLGIVDVLDADTRILGRTKLRDTLNNVIDPMPKTGGSVDVTDRAARALGIIASITAAVDVSDRAGRALGAVSSAQLPAALVGGRMDVNIGAAISLPVTVVDGGDVAQGAKADAVWDGVTVATTISAVMKYIGQKVEAARALLAGFLKFGERENGYAHLAMYAEAVAGIIAETAISMQFSRAFAAPAAATSNGAAAAKELVITGIMVAWISTSTTANTVRLRIRVNPAGAAVIGSPIALTIRLAWESATFIANEGSWQTLMFPKPIVIPNPGQFMATLACVAANGTLDVQLLGYERTP